MKHVMVMMGTRPEAIKLCPLIAELKKRPDFSVSVVSSGQHEELLADVMHAFEMIPDHSFHTMRAGQSPAALFSKILDKTDALLKQERPDVVIVQGDTTTAFAGAQAAFYQKIPIGHVEAGLRTYHIHSPFPEEYHRRAIALVADYHFAPTVTASKNLLREGIDEKKVFITGNTVVDALRYTLQKKDAVNLPTIPKGARLLVFTAHRREHFGKTLLGMLSALKRIVEAHPDVVAVCPLHPNPNVRKAAARILSGHPRILCIEPPNVIAFHKLLSQAYLVLTDSGGIQEETVALGVPTVVMRYSTERTEGILAGNLRLSGSGECGIFDTANMLLYPNSEMYMSMCKPSHVFGDGNASSRIADILQKN